LVVDDAAENRMLVSALLIQQGFRVDQAADGEAAVQAAEEKLPDLIVLDIGLPDIDGVEVCRRVRSFSDAHVLMLTAQDTELDKVVGFEAGADDYVTKPFSIAELVGRCKARLRSVTSRPALLGAPVVPVSPVRTFCSLAVDPLAREVVLDGTTL